MLCWDALLLEGQTLTMDAAFTQWTVAEQIVHQGGAYLMVVKGNQAHMRAHIAERTASLGRCPARHRPVAWPTVGWSSARCGVARRHRIWAGRMRARCSVLAATSSANALGRCSNQTVYAVTSLAPTRPAQTSCCAYGRRTGASRACSGCATRSFARTTHHAHGARAPGLRCLT